MFFSHHQFPPEDRQLLRSSEQSSPVKELRDTILSVIVVHRNFGENIPRILELLYHLQTDGATIALQCDLIKNSAANEPKITIYVP
jgi:hypothetical protein